MVGIIPVLTEKEAKSELFPTSEQRAFFFNSDDNFRPYTIDANRNPQPISDLYGTNCDCLAPISNSSSGTVQVGNGKAQTSVVDQKKRGSITFGNLTIKASESSKFEGSVSKGVYYLNVIADSSGTNATKLFASVTKPESLGGGLPSGYDLYRHVGMLPIVSGPSIPDLIIKGNKVAFKKSQSDFRKSPATDSANSTLLNVPGGTAAVSHVKEMGIVTQATDSSGSKQAVNFGYNAADAYLSFDVPANSTVDEKIDVPVESGGFGFNSSNSSTIVDGATCSSFEFELEALI